jgi:lathosterol oxidase
MEWFQDLAAQFFAVWPTIFAFDLGRYLIAAGVAAAALYFLARALADRRIRNVDPTPGQRIAEFSASVRTALVFSIVGFGIHLGVTYGVLQIYPHVTDRGWVYFFASLVLAIVAQDAYFYWTHRAMHHPALFRWFHRRHHRSVRPTPWAAYSFDLPEAVVQALFLPLYLAAVPMHGAAIFLFLIHMIVRNVMGHSGYELMPRSLGRSRAWGWLNSVTHHDLHHETFRWNYGLYFTWWDRWMGTEHPEYRSRLEGKQTQVWRRVDDLCRGSS